MPLFYMMTKLLNASAAPFDELIDLRVRFYLDWIGSARTGVMIRS